MSTLVTAAAGELFCSGNRIRSINTSHRHVKQKQDANSKCCKLTMEHLHFFSIFLLEKQICSIEDEILKNQASSPKAILFLLSEMYLSSKSFMMRSYE